MSVLPMNTNPANRVAQVTPSDTNPLPFVSRGISFAGVGDLKIDTAGGDAGVVIPSGALAAGILWPICATKVYATGTAATGIVIYGG